MAALVAAVVASVALGLAGTTVGFLVALDHAHDARTARGAAEEQAALAVAKAAEARDQAELANQRLYIARMNLVQRAWDDWSPDVFHEILEEQRPENQGGVDRRGWEWYFWQRKSKTGSTTLKVHEGWVHGVAFAPDGSRLASAGEDETVRVWDARPMEP